MAERMTLEGLRYARAVRVTGSFSAAARAYAVTQPALSSSVATLESLLGGALFDRTTRGATPTAFGLAILPLVEYALGAIDTVVAEAAKRQEPAVGNIRMGVSPLVDPRVVAAAYAAACGTPSGFPHRKLILNEANMTELREALTVGDLDIIVVPSVAPMPRYAHRVIGSEPMVVVESYSESTIPAPLRELTGAQLILLPDTCGLTAFTRDLLAAAAIPVRAYPGAAGSYGVLEQWATLGLGTALLPESKLANPRTPRRELIDDEGIRVEIFYEAIWDPRHTLTSELSALADRLALPRP